MTILANLAASDVGVFGAMLAIFSALVIFSMRKRSRGFFEFLTCGRSVTLPAFALSTTGVWYGGIFGTSADFHGLSLGQLLAQHALIYGAYVVFATVVVPRLRKIGQTTVPEIFARTISPTFGRLIAAVTIVALLPLPLTAALGVLLESTTGLNATLAMSVALVVIASYAALGGCRTVLATDIASCLLVFMGLAAVLFFSWQRFGGVDYLVANLPPPLPNQTPWYAGAIFAVAIFGNPMLVHRSFIAEDTRAATTGLLLATLLWFVFDLLLLVGVQYAQAALPTAAPAAAYFSYALQILPVGLKGFFLAAVLIALVSTLDSYLFLAGATLANDLNPKKVSMPLARVATFALAAFCALLAPLLGSSWASISSSLGVALGCLVIAVGYGLVTGQQNQK